MSKNIVCLTITHWRTSGFFPAFTVTDKKQKCILLWFRDQKSEIRITKLRYSRSGLPLSLMCASCGGCRYSLTCDYITYSGSVVTMLPPLFKILNLIAPGKILFSKQDNIFRFQGFWCGNFWWGREEYIFQPTTVSFSLWIKCSLVQLLGHMVIAYFYEKLPNSFPW